MTRLAVEHQAVNLGQGFPDFPAPDFVKDAARGGHRRGPQPVRAVARPAAAAPGDGRATSSAGTAWPSTPPARSPSPTGPPRRCSTPSWRWSIPATRSSSSSRSTIPTCPRSRWPAATVAGRAPAPARWDFDPDELRRAFTPRTKLVVLNTPHNPTGKVWTSGRAGPAGATVPAARRAGAGRRGVQRDHLRRRRPRPHRHPPRDARADHHRRQHRQDLQRDRLEDRLGHGRPRADPGPPRACTSSSPSASPPRCRRRPPPRWTRPRGRGYFAELRRRVHRPPRTPDRDPGRAWAGHACRSAAPTSC